MRVGVTLPQFRSEADTALAAARQAEQLGLDGVFVFDHLWPMGSPQRPIVAALPMMGALVEETDRLWIGSLVMRIGVVPDEVLIEEMSDLAGMAPGRFIAGLGTGDRLSEAENRAYGLAYPPAAERRASLSSCAGALGSAGVPVWLGAGATLARATLEIARQTGAALNLWDSGVAALEADAGVELTWGGPIAGGALAIATRLSELDDAGASWVVCAWPESLADVAEGVALWRSGSGR